MLCHVNHPFGCVTLGVLPTRGRVWVPAISRFRWASGMALPRPPFEEASLEELSWSSADFLAPAKPDLFVYGGCPFSVLKGTQKDHGHFQMWVSWNKGSQVGCFPFGFLLSTNQTGPKFIVSLNRHRGTRFPTCHRFCLHDGAL